MAGSRVVGIADSGPGTCPVPVQAQLQGTPVVEAVSAAGCGQYGSTIVNARGTIAYARGSIFPSTTVAVVHPQQGERDLGKPEGAVNAVPVALSESDDLVVQSGFDNLNRYEVFVLDVKGSIAHPWKRLPHLFEGGSSGAWTINARGEIYGWSREAGGTKRAVVWKPSENPGAAPTYTIEDLNERPGLPPGWQLVSIYASHASAGVVGEARIDGKPRLFRIDQGGKFSDLGWPHIAGVAAETAFVSAVNGNGTAVGDAVIWSPKIIQTGILITSEEISPLPDLVELPGLTILGARGIDETNRILIRAAVTETQKERIVVLTPVDRCWLPSPQVASCPPKDACKEQLEGTACDDGNACTVGDRCMSGTCFGIAKTCDDNDACTIDSCTEGSCSFSRIVESNGSGEGCCSGVVAGQRLEVSSAAPGVYEETWESCGNAVETQDGGAVIHSQDQEWHRCAPAAGGRVTQLTVAPLRTSWFSPIRVAAGSTYCLSVALRWGSGWRPYVGLLRVDAQGTEQPLDRLIGGSGSNGVGGSQTPLVPGLPAWRYYRSQFTAPTGTDAIRIEVGLDSVASQGHEVSGASAVDDLQVRQGACF